MSEKVPFNRENYPDFDAQMLRNLADFINLFRVGRPDDRSDKDRRYAIVLTELEKVQAYIDTFIVRG